MDMVDCEIKGSELQFAEVGLLGNDDSDDSHDSD